MDITAKFGKRVKKIRTSKRMSQSDLARVLGVHPNYISGVERGLENMSLKSIEKLARALKIPVIKLLS